MSVPPISMTVPLTPPSFKVALIHDWLTGMRGGEKVLEAFLDIFPQAEIFTLVYVPGSVSKKIESKKIHTSFLQKIPGVDKRYRHMLPLMPFAIERFDLSGFDLVISSSHCVAKGVHVPNNTPHICYCYTPMRYIWDQYNDYFGSGKSNPAVRAAMKCLVPWLRHWDRNTAKRVTKFIAISENVRQRIIRHYNCDAVVAHAPCDTEFYTPGNLLENSKAGNYYLMITALVPYKRVDIAIEALNRIKKPLWITGTGPELNKLKKIAGPTVKFIGWASNEDIRKLYRNCRSLIFPGMEDYGIVPIEAMSCGSPVIAYKAGGALETVVEGVTGLFFNEQTPESLIGAIGRFEKIKFEPAVLHQHALKFSYSKFYENIKVIIRGR